jgi:hypothetical protein
MKIKCLISFIYFLMLASLSFYASAQSKSNTLYEGSKLSKNQKIYSDNKEFYLTLLNDGNLAVFNKDNIKTWTTNMTSGTGTYLKLSSDGNLAVYCANNNIVWQSKTTPFYNPDYKNKDWKATRLVVENDGRIVLYSSENKKVWDNIGLSAKTSSPHNTVNGNPTPNPAGRILPQTQSSTNTNSNTRTASQPATTQPERTRIAPQKVERTRIAPAPVPPQPERTRIAPQKVERTRIAPAPAPPQAERTRIAPQKVERTRIAPAPTPPQSERTRIAPQKVERTRIAPVPQNNAALQGNKVPAQMPQEQTIKRFSSSTQRTRLANSAQRQRLLPFMLTQGSPVRTGSIWERYRIPVGRNYTAAQRLSPSIVQRFRMPVLLPPPPPERQRIYPVRFKRERLVVLPLPKPPARTRIAPAPKAQ